VGEKVALSASIANPGSLPASFRVTLEIDGRPLETREEALAAGESREVVFSYSGGSPGAHTATVGDVSVQFSIRPKAAVASPAVKQTGEKGFPWFISGGIILGIIVAGSIIFLVTKARKSHSR
jgi:hypothetical protein